jgi:hypothetical protein
MRRCFWFLIVGIALHNSCSRFWSVVLENLGPQNHLAISIDLSVYTDRAIAITIQQAKKFALGSKTKISRVLVDWVDNSLHPLIVSAYLQGDHALSTCGKEILLGKDSAIHGQPESLQASPRQDDAAPVFVLVQFSQPRGDIPA